MAWSSAEVRGSGEVSTFDGRLAFVEGRVVEHSQMLDGIRTAIVSLEGRMDSRFEAIDRRFETIDRRFEAIDANLRVSSRGWLASR